MCVCVSVSVSAVKYASLYFYHWCSLMRRSHDCPETLQLSLLFPFSFPASSVLFFFLLLSSRISSHLLSSPLISYLPSVSLAYSLSSRYVVFLCFCLFCLGRLSRLSLTFFCLALQLILFFFHPHFSCTFCSWLPSSDLSQSSLLFFSIFSWFNQLFPFCFNHSSLSVVSPFLLFLLLNVLCNVYDSLSNLCSVCLLVF